MDDQWNHKIFNVTKDGFPVLAMEIFRYQYEHNPVYRSFVQTLGTDPGKIKKINEIPFLPIGFFKTHAVQTESFEPAMIFESSGTTGSMPSRHLVKDLMLYEESFIKGFSNIYGPVEKWCILGLLPSYLERSHSSLVYMVDRMIRLSGHEQSGFFLHDSNKLKSTLEKLENAGQQTLLIGVTYALLDFAEKYQFRLSNTVIMETGGMKGRRDELVRDEVHAILKKAFQVDSVHSEYGMTELMSQAYSTGNGIFQGAPWMRFFVRDEEDPLQLNEQGNGVLNVIDLANVHSCSFIATEDAGKLYPDGSFEVLGRVDNSDIRGCSLLINDPNHAW